MVFHGEGWCLMLLVVVVVFIIIIMTIAIFDGEWLTTDGSCAPTPTGSTRVGSSDSQS